MADILEFRVKTASTGHRAQRGRRVETPAEIVIFPGIRYERWSEAASAAAKPATERDLLRLVE